MNFYEEETIEEYWMCEGCKATNKSNNGYCWMCGEQYIETLEEDD